jgi:hypothetical protein
MTYHPLYLIFSTHYVVIDEPSNANSSQSRPVLFDDEPPWQFLLDGSLFVVISLLHPHSEEQEGKWGDST